MQQEIKLKAEKEYKSKIANMEIENFRRRDFYVLKEKKEKEKEKELEKIEKQKRIDSARADPNIPNDPTRLYQMTSAWRKRMETPRAESCGPVVKTQHLAVPSWRKGV